MLERGEYRSSLRAMWLGQVIANWTGIRTEGARQAPPFFTDADWGTSPDGGPPIDFVLNQDPWRADDDTDVEYVYLHLLDSLGRTRLSPADIRTGWVAHINRFIWVSNERARQLMNRGVAPPATSLTVPNQFALFIDAQLTTEFFGALCPGMPERALEMADLPIRTTSTGYAAHASQFYVVLYSLATQVPAEVRAQGGREAAVWLVRSARAFIPDSSKSADAVDFVLADFLANPDPGNWERTRDLVADRYQINAAANGFVYRGWTESTVNFASGVIALLYGGLDFRRTVQIGTLSGWDSDNGTATMGGLLGLVHGYDALVASFPGHEFSDRFWISRTRDNLPDYLPHDAEAEDTFALMAERMLGIVDREVSTAGGRTGPWFWVLPPAVVYEGESRLAGSATHRLQRRSANNEVRARGGVVTAASSVAGANPPFPGVSAAARFADGYEHDFAGAEDYYSRRAYYSTQGAALTEPVMLAVNYSLPIEAEVVRFIEGDHSATGGWFTDLAVELLVGGQWIAPAGAWSGPIDPLTPYQILDFALSAPIAGVTGVRIRGSAGGSTPFITCCELDVLTTLAPQRRGGFDLNGDGVVDVQDAYLFEYMPVDVNGDGAITDDDRWLLHAAVRCGEREDMFGGRD